MYTLIFNSYLLILSEGGGIGGGYSTETFSLFLGIDAASVGL